MEPAVEDSGADLEQAMRADRRPTHLPSLVRIHPATAAFRRGAEPVL
jgi:hypothetical protein